MKAVILYHPNAEFARQTEEYVADFERTHVQKIELQSLETKEGSDTAKTYDIVRYPALLVIRDSGELVRGWQGETMPLMNEVAGYLGG